MTEIKTSLELKQAIVDLETVRSREGSVLRQQMLETVEIFNPQTIVKATARKFFGDHDWKALVLNTVIGVVIGLLTNSALRAVAVRPISRFVASTLVGMVSNKNLLNHNSGILIRGTTLLKKMFSK